MHKPSNTLQQVKEWLEKRSRYPHETMKKWDALYYIQQLEARLAQVERKRDAAIADLKLYAGCKVCKHGDFKFPKECMDCGDETNYWQWRGVCEENTHDQP